MKPLYRIAIVVSSFLFGGVILFALTYVGDKSRGPLADIFDMAGDAVRKTEERYIYENRRNEREEKLSWLQTGSTDLKDPEHILTGAFDNQATDSYRAIFELENMLGTTFPLIHIYTAWGSRDNQRFPVLEVESIQETGSLPVITWEPWLTDFDSEEYPGIRPVETRDIGGLKDIAAGLYDAYIEKWALEAKNAAGPIYLRLGHEMNDPYRYPWGPQHNEPADFIAAWKHVHGLFREAGVDNVIWVWSPHPAYGWFREYYPGDAYVDYVGVGVLNYGNVAHWSDWWSFEDIFGKYYDELSAFGKPIMITEFGSLAVGGDRSQWYAEALTNLTGRYPMVKSLLFFHFSEDRTTTPETLNWYLKYDTASVKAIRTAMNTWE